MGIAAYPDPLSIDLFAFVSAFFLFFSQDCLQKNVRVGGCSARFGFSSFIQLSFHGKSLWLSMAFAKISYVLITDWRPI